VSIDTSRNIYFPSEPPKGFPGADSLWILSITLF
jgi:hypothetical protein